MPIPDFQTLMLPFLQMLNDNCQIGVHLVEKKTLRGKVNINELNAILQEIMEQAEGQYSEWRA